MLHLFGKDVDRVSSEEPIRTASVLPKNTSVVSTDSAAGNALFASEANAVVFTAKINASVSIVEISFFMMFLLSDSKQFLS